ncbi:MAG: PKD domain-containing protein, partial [Planctomycetes bacterium]|nr:PKD domain-containing protein [Planctomycetota bacterium]
EYLWNFGDGTTGSGQKVSHLYPEKGIYNATLTVRDDSKAEFCATHSTSFRVIFNHPPVADVGSDHITCVGEEVEFDGSNSYDIDGTITDYIWDFGDGSPLYTGALATWSYQNPGNYVASLTVKDDSEDDCGNQVAHRFIEVNMPPVAEAGPDQTVSVDQLISFSAKSSYDPDGAIKTYRWDFGEGSPIKEQPGPYHSFVSSGVYTVTLSVTDNSNTACNTDADQLTVTVNEMPEANAGQDIATCEATVFFDAGQSLDPDDGNLNYEWDFGDDSPRGRGQTIFHTFVRPGKYPVTLKVCDDSVTESACNT